MQQSGGEISLSLTFCRNEDTADLGVKQAFPALKVRPERNLGRIAQVNTVQTGSRATPSNG
jgi:hypothetical protein